MTMTKMVCEPALLMMQARQLAEERITINELRGLLKHAYNCVAWEQTTVRTGFKEEIEAALSLKKK